VESGFTVQISLAILFGILFSFIVEKVVQTVVEREVVVQKETVVEVVPAPVVVVPQATPYYDVFFEDYGVNPVIDTEDDHLSTFAIIVASFSPVNLFLLCT
jgi:hypothetical protein